MSDAPYPAETRAKGWRFELDYEQIEQSSTWALAAMEVRPWLLMLWFTAWKQVPCGSLPTDEEVVAAMIGMNPKAWSKHQKVLMRGWYEASDGRLYHDTLSLRVREMLARRRSDADRKAAERARKPKDSPETPGGITPESRGTPDGLTRESSTDTDNLQPTKDSSPSVKARKRAASRPDDVGEQTWSEWTAHRAKKRSSVTEGVIEDARKEADKAGLTLDAFLREWVFRGSVGLKADWLAESKPRGAVFPFNRQLAIEAENKRVGAEWLAQQAETG